MKNISILQENYSQLDAFVKTFVKGLEFYVKTVPTTADQPWVMFVIEDLEQNVPDQKHLEAELMFKHKIFSVRATFF